MMSEKKFLNCKLEISVKYSTCDAYLSEITESDIATISTPMEPKTVIYNNYLKDAQVINFSNEMKDKAQQTASNFIQNDNTPLLQLIYELRDTIEALPIEIQETINIDLDDITEEVNKARDQRNPQRLKHRPQGVGNAIHKAATLLKDPGDIAKAITSLAGLANLCGIHLPPISISITKVLRFLIAGR
jgi:hypothetical protein